MFTWLKSQSPEEIVNGFKDKATMKMVEKLSKTTKEPGDIKCNFTKFLVDRSGKVVARFAPTEAPKEIESKIKELL